MELTAVLLLDIVARILAAVGKEEPVSAFTSCDGRPPFTEIGRKRNRSYGSCKNHFQLNASREANHRLLPRQGRPEEDGTQYSLEHR